MPARPAASEAGERLHKSLARAGWGSRREIEKLIVDGHIRLNGQIAATGATVRPGDRVQLDGGREMRVEPVAAAVRVLAYHKPVGTVCTRRDEEGRRTIFDRLPAIRDGRWINVGRLDINTSGLLLFTNDGELANRLMHPRYRVDREYAARVYGVVDAPMLVRLRAGVDIDGETCRFEDIVQGHGRAQDLDDDSGANRWFTCVVQSGKNREVRRLWESQGVQVARLLRVRFANIMLPTDLRPGRQVEIGGQLLEDLCRLVRLPGTPPAPRKAPAARRPKARPGRR